MIKVYSGYDNSEIMTYLMKNPKSGDVRNYDYLHPKLQIEKIKEILNSDIKNINIISNSPFIWQAFKKYNNSKMIEYYLVIDKNNVENVSLDLNIVFKTFSTPLQEMVWN